MEILKKHVDKKLARSKKKLEELKENHGNDPGNTHTYWGGESLGYLKGKITAFEDILDLLEDIEIEENLIKTPFIDFNMYTMRDFTANPCIKVLCIFEVKGKEHRIEETFTEWSIVKLNAEDAKIAILKEVFKKVVQKLVYECINSFDMSVVKL